MDCIAAFCLVALYCATLSQSFPRAPSNIKASQQMSQSIDFETPENVRLSYRVAGLGSRFVAWFVDNIYIWLMMFILGVIFMVIAVAAESTIDVWFEDLVDSTINPEEMSEEEMGMRIAMFLFGIWIIVWGLGSFVYYFLAELSMRGQTPGKKMMKIRVVKADGFSLDPGSIFLRNIFRPIDQIPLLWIVPLLSPNSRRFGDMVGGTLVVSNDQQEISPLREQLLEQQRADAKFRFSASSLERLSAEEISTIEEFCERIGDLNAQRRMQLLEIMVPPLAQKLRVELPSKSEYDEFLFDLLTAEYRRQERRLG